MELYAGIGGFAAALDGSWEVVAAVDIHRRALDVHRSRFEQPVEVRTIESLTAADFERWSAEFWWLSPPCQPYTRRGLRRDLDDRRSLSLRRLIERLDEDPPRALALENVPGFAGSQAHELLREVLGRHGYEVAETELCPSELGIPMRRRRFYLAASRSGLQPKPLPSLETRPLAGFLDAAPDLGELAVDPRLIEQYRHAVDVVVPEDPAAMASCFTAAYGRSTVRSGSYLRCGSSLRRFSPTEIARLLEYPAAPPLERTVGTKRAWSLLGNSLSVTAVRQILSWFPTAASAFDGEW